MESGDRPSGRQKQQLPHPVLLRPLSSQWYPKLQTAFYSCKGHSRFGVAIEASSMSAEEHHQQNELSLEFHHVVFKV